MMISMALGTCGLVALMSGLLFTRREFDKVQLGAVFIASSIASYFLYKLLMENIEDSVKGEEKDILEGRIMSLIHWEYTAEEWKIVMKEIIPKDTGWLRTILIVFFIQFALTYMMGSSTSMSKSTVGIILLLLGLVIISLFVGKEEQKSIAELVNLEKREIRITSVYILYGQNYLTSFKLYGTSLKTANLIEKDGNTYIKMDLMHRHRNNIMTSSSTHILVPKGKVDEAEWLIQRL